MRQWFFAGKTRGFHVRGLKSAEGRSKYNSDSVVWKCSVFWLTISALGGDILYWKFEHFVPSGNEFPDGGKFGASCNKRCWRRTHPAPCGAGWFI